MKPGKAIAVTEIMETVVNTVAVDSRMVALLANPVATTAKLPMSVLAEVTASPAPHRLVLVVVVPADPVT